MSSNHGLSRFKSALRLRIEWLATLVLTWLVGDVGPNRMSVLPMISFFHNRLIKVWYWFSSLFKARQGEQQRVLPRFVPELCIRNSVVRSQSRKEHFSKRDGAKCYHNQNTNQVVWLEVEVLPRYLNSYVEWLSTGLANFSTASEVEKNGFSNVFNFMYSG